MLNLIKTTFPSSMAEKQVQEKPRKVIMYPLESDAYQILDEVGRGSSSVVYKASCIPMCNSTVAIKVIELDHSVISHFHKNICEATSSHANILSMHCCFIVGKSLWVVMQFMHAGSVESIIGYSAFLDGISEKCIAFVLKESLTALAFLHDQGQFHKDIKPGNILIDSDGSVKLADFGVFTAFYGSNSSRSSEFFVSPYWVAPEVLMSHSNCGFKADIWSFGITALELAYGRPPLSNLSLSKSGFMKLNKRFRFSGYDKGEGKKNKKFSEAFGDMVGLCLDQDPLRRPSAEELLKHRFFRECSEGPDFLVKNLLQGLPNIGERFKDENKSQFALENEKYDEQDCIVGENVQHRRIIGWTFNVERLEMEPVFPAEKEEDGIVKQVRFGGEIIIQEKGGDSNSAVQGLPITGCGHSEGGYIKEAMMKGSLFLMKSLEDQKAKIMQIIAFLGGEGGGENVEMSREEELMKMNEQLMKDLENEEMKNLALEIELEILKLTFSQ